MPPCRTGKGNRQGNTETLERGTALEMTRKDSEKESERPHYYSQFWLDVAAGRKIIGASREEEAAEPEEVAPRKSTRSASATIEHEEPAYTEVGAPAAEEEAFEPEAYTEPEPEEDFLGAEEEFDADQELPNIVVDEEEAEVPDVELLDEDEDEDFYNEEEEEEDEDVDWGRGRKKPKPGRQTKQPPKRTKRDRDRRY